MQLLVPVEEMNDEHLLALAASRGLEVRAEGLRFEDAGLDYRVGFARAVDGVDWVLRVPRRPDVSAKLGEERRILDFIAPRLSVAVPRWEICDEGLIAYRRLPGEPGLTLDATGQPVWHVDPTSAELATAFGRLIAELQQIDGTAAREFGVPSSTMVQSRARWRADLERVQAEFVIDPLLRERWEAWLANDALWPEPVALTHGELYAAHVLLDGPGRIVGVLDWTTAKVGDPAIDFAYQHMMGPEAFDATVAAYLEAGGREIPQLAERCAELIAAAPLNYALFALQTGASAHREVAAAQLNPHIAAG